jgi:hypothetical protein
MYSTALKCTLCVLLASNTILQYILFVFVDCKLITVSGTLALFINVCTVHFDRKIYYSVHYPFFGALTFKVLLFILRALVITVDAESTTLVIFLVDHITWYTCSRLYVVYCVNCSYCQQSRFLCALHYHSKDCLY